MKKGKYQKDTGKSFPWRISVVIFIVLIVIIIMICKTCGYTPNDTSEKEHQTETTVEKNPDSIAIPGYEMLELKEGSKEQSLRMPNPPQNCCYFQIALYLEDGTLLWKSELIEPGATSKPIVLSKTLEKGTYPNAILRYSCYRMDETLAPLNGAETKLTLWVK